MTSRIVCICTTPPNRFQESMLRAVPSAAEPPQVALERSHFFLQLVAIVLKFASASLCDSRLCLHAGPKLRYGHAVHLRLL